MEQPKDTTSINPSIAENLFTPEVEPPPRFQIERDELTRRVIRLSGTLPSPIPETNGWEAEYHLTEPWNNRSEFKT